MRTGDPERSQLVSTKTLGLVVVVGMALQPLIVWAFAFIRPDLPLTVPDSEYALGTFGWLWALAFIATGMGALALAWGLGRTLSPGKRVRLALVVLGIFGLLQIYAGMSKSGHPLDDLPRYLSMPTLLASFFMLRGVVARDPRWRPMATPTLIVGLWFLGWLVALFQPFSKILESEWQRFGALPVFVWGVAMGWWLRWLGTEHVEVGPSVAGPAATEATGQDSDSEETRQVVGHDSRHQPSRMLLFGMIGLVGVVAAAMTLVLAPGPAGTYTSSEFEPALEYTIPDGWWTPGDSPRALLLQTFPDPIDGEIGIISDLVAYRSDSPTEIAEGVGRSAEDLVTWLATHPELDTTDPEPVTVGGLAGFQLELQIAAGPGWCDPTDIFCVNLLGQDPPEWWVVAIVDPRVQPWLARLIILDRGGDTGTLAIVVVPFVPFVESAEAFFEVAQPIIDSFSFSN